MTAEFRLVRDPEFAWPGIYDWIWPVVLECSACGRQVEKPIPTKPLQHPILVVCIGCHAPRPVVDAYTALADHLREIAAMTPPKPPKPRQAPPKRIPQRLRSVTQAAALLRERRIELGMTLIEVCDICDMSRSNLGRVERSEGPVTDQMVYRLSKIYGSDWSQAMLPLYSQTEARVREKIKLGVTP